MNENKVPCGGFRIGDGLTMEGNTLKSLGGVRRVLVAQTGELEYGYAESSPIKNYEELDQAVNSGLVFCSDEMEEVYTYVGFDEGHIFVGVNFMGNDMLILKKYIFKNDNTVSKDSWQFTPAT